MPRKLKVYTTSIGFFDLAIAAPSMKAALAAWGADSNLFHQNFAKEVHDADIVEVAMAHPGVVLKQPVGSTKSFAETSDLPDDLVAHVSRSATTSKRRNGKASHSPKPETRSRKASAAYERAEKSRQAQERREEAKRDAARRRREAAIAKAEQRLTDAEADHSAKLAAIAVDRAQIDARERAEEDRWNASRRKLPAALAKAKQTE